MLLGWPLRLWIYRDIRKTTENVTYVNKALNKKYKTLRKYYKTSRKCYTHFAIYYEYFGCLKDFMTLRCVSFQLIFLLRFCLFKQYKFQRFVSSENWTDSVRWFHNKKSSHSQLFFKIDIVKSFAIFTGKHLCWNLFLIKLQGALNFIKKRFRHRCFPVNIAKFFSTAFFIKQVRWLLLNGIMLNKHLIT